MHHVFFDQWFPLLRSSISPKSSYPFDIIFFNLFPPYYSIWMARWSDTHESHPLVRIKAANMPRHFMTASGWSRSVSRTATSYSLQRAEPRIQSTNLPAGMPKPNLYPSYWCSNRIEGVAAFQSVTSCLGRYVGYQGMVVRSFRKPSWWQPIWGLKTVVCEGGVGNEGLDVKTHCEALWYSQKLYLSGNQDWDLLPPSGGIAEFWLLSTT